MMLYFTYLTNKILSNAVPWLFIIFLSSSHQSSTRKIKLRSAPSVEVNFLKEDENAETVNTSYRCRRKTDHLNPSGGLSKGKQSPNTQWNHQKISSAPTWRHVNTDSCGTTRRFYCVSEQKHRKSQDSTKDDCDQHFLCGNKVPLIKPEACGDNEPLWVITSEGNILPLDPTDRNVFNNIYYTSSGSVEVITPRESPGDKIVIPRAVSQSVLEDNTVESLGEDSHKTMITGNSIQFTGVRKRGPRRRLLGISYDPQHEQRISGLQNCLTTHEIKVPKTLLRPCYRSRTVINDSTVLRMDSPMDRKSNVSATTFCHSQRNTNMGSTNGIGKQGRPKWPSIGEFIDLQSGRYSYCSETGSTMSQYLAPNSPCSSSIGDDPLERNSSIRTPIVIPSHTCGTDAGCSCCGEDSESGKFGLSSRERNSPSQAQTSMCEIPRLTPRRGASNGKKVFTLVTYRLSYVKCKWSILIFQKLEKKKHMKLLLPLITSWTQFIGAFHMYSLVDVEECCELRLDMSWTFIAQNRLISWVTPRLEFSFNFLTQELSKTNQCSLCT